MPKEKKETITQELTIIDKPSQAIALYKITPAEIAERLKAYDGLKVVEGDGKSYKEVRSVLTALVHTRTGIEESRLALGRNYRGLIEKSISNINEAAEMLANQMAPYEARFSSELKTEDARLDAIKAEKIRLEEERKESIRAEIHKIQEMAMPTILGTMALENLRELSGRLEDMDIGHDEYMESTEEARKVQDDAYNAVQDAITARIQLDKEAEKRKAEDKHLEKVREKQKVDQAKIDEANRKLKEAQKKIDDDKAELAAEKQAEADRKDKEAFEKAATEKAEAAARTKVADAANKKEEKEKADEVKKARQEALAPDKDKLIKWIESFNETAIPDPQLKSKAAKEIYRIARGQIEIILQNTMVKIEEL